MQRVLRTSDATPGMKHIKSIIVERKAVVELNAMHVILPTERVKLSKECSKEGCACSVARIHMAPTPDLENRARRFAMERKAAAERGAIRAMLPTERLELSEECK